MFDLLEYNRSNRLKKELEYKINYIDSFLHARCNDSDLIQAMKQSREEFSDSLRVLL